MSLSILMEKGGLAKVTTATLATAATHRVQEFPTVAKVATVSVTEPPDDALLTLVPNLTDTQESAVRYWLAYIEEHDATTIEDVLHKCRTSTRAHDYFLRQANEVLQGAGKQMSDQKS